MKIFFLLRHTGYFRLFEAVTDELVNRGHEVHLAFLNNHWLQDLSAIEQHYAGKPVTFSIHRQKWIGELPARLLRRAQDFSRYLDRRYDSAPLLRRRAATRLPAPVCFLIRFLLGNKDSRRWKFIRAMRALDALLPIPEFVLHSLKTENPDVFLITPLVDFGAEQLDWLKAAQMLDVPNILCVASWDNLTNKGLIQREPDRILVWNEAQKKEAMELHGMPAVKVKAVGAGCFDRWFSARPGQSREYFCRKAGLVGTDYILYLGSSRFIARNEGSFFQEWLGQLRQHPDPAISRLEVVIRPHPQNAAQWEAMQSLPGVAVYPRGGAVPVSAAARDDYADSIFYSRAVFGLNTTGMIEAAILGKPVLTLLHPDFSGSQEGTFHFRYLQEGRMLQTASSYSTHFRQLAEILELKSCMRPDAFLQWFLRPAGLDRPCVPVWADEIEALMPVKPIRNELAAGTESKVSI